MHLLEKFVPLSWLLSMVFLRTLWLSDLNMYFLTGTSLWNRGSTKVALYSNKVRDSVKIGSAMTSLMCTYWQ